MKLESVAMQPPANPGTFQYLGTACGRAGVLVFVSWLAAVATASAQLPPASFTASITNGPGVVTVDFTLHPIRSPNFSVVVQNSSGGLDLRAAPAARTYLGTVQGHPGALAAAVRKPDGTLMARVCFEDQVEWFTSGGPASTRGQPAWTKNWPGFTIGAGGAGGAGGNVYAAEVGVDSSYEHFARSGFDVDANVQVIEYTILCANLYYLRDASILHRIGRIVIRGDQIKDPYRNKTAGALLEELRNQWNNVLPAGTHDVAAGVFASSVGGGLAWVGSIGTESRYSVNDSEDDGDFSVYWRHEVGHNWGNGHFEGNTPEGPTIMSGNALGRFSTPELVRVVDHRDTRLGILEPFGGYSYPLPPRASLDFAPATVGGTLLIDVLANDHDANGDGISILGFDAATSLGGPISLQAGQLKIQNVADHQEVDWFNYRIADDTGRTATGIVYVQGEKPSVKLAGTGIGTPGAWCCGTTFDQALDGDVNTFYDAANGSGDWVGLDLGAGSNVAVTKVRFTPRAGWASRMNGGQIQASPVADFSSGVISLFTINGDPAEGAPTTQLLNNNLAYRYVRYLGPVDGFCNLAEIEFWGGEPSPPHAPWSVSAAGVSSTQVTIGWRAPAFASSYQVRGSTTPGGPYTLIATGLTTTNFTDNGRFIGTTYYYVVSAINSVGVSADSAEVSATPATPAHFSGPIIGTPGTYCCGNTIDNVFDGNLNTFYDAEHESGDWAGLDLGTARSIRQVRFAPRAGNELRMVGGRFQGANVADFSSGAVTFGTIAAAPPAGVLTTINVPNGSAFRYVRYLGPDGGWCNVAEVQFLGVTAPAGPTTLSSMDLLSKGHVSLVLAGAPGQPLVLQAATALTEPITWMSLSTNFAGPNGTAPVLDLQAAGLPTRLYRIKTP